MTRMPSFPRPARLRLLLAAASVAVALLALPAAPASAAFPHIEVAIFPPKGDTKITYLDQVEKPENYGTYAIRDRNGRDREPVVVGFGDGISIRQILDQESADDYGTVDLVIAGRTVHLTKKQVDNPNSSPMLYVDDAGEVFFLRPSTGPSDYNASDHFRVTTAAIQLEQTPARPKLRLSADDRRIEPGESVAFDVEVTGGLPGAKYQFTWVFGDDSDQERTSRSFNTHTFAKEGTYRVFVTGKAPDSMRSDPSNVVKIQVGDGKEEEPPPATSSPGSGTGTGTGTGSSGYTPSVPTTPVTPSTPSTPAPPPSDPLDTPGITTDSGTPVEGNLLADASTPPATSILESAAEAAREAKQKDDDDDPSASVPDAAFAFAGVLALMGLGAGMELRQGRPLSWAALRRRAGALRSRLPRRGA
jgi:PKD domain